MFFKVKPLRLVGSERNIKYQFTEYEYDLYLNKDTIEAIKIDGDYSEIYVKYNEHANIVIETKRAVEILQILEEK